MFTLLFIVCTLGTKDCSVKVIAEDIKTIEDCQTVGRVMTRLWQVQHPEETLRAARCTSDPGQYLGDEV